MCNTLQNRCYPYDFCGPQPFIHRLFNKAVENSPRGSAL